MRDRGFAPCNQQISAAAYNKSGIIYVTGAAVCRAGNGSARFVQTIMKRRYTMGEKHKILSVGGDMRSVYCAARLATEYDTSILGFDAEDIPHGSGLHI